MGMDISENKLLEGPLMTNEREKEEAKVTLEELLHQIQVIHLELKIVRNWSYFVFFFFFWRWYACQLDQTSK